MKTSKHKTMEEGTMLWEPDGIIQVIVRNVTQSVFGMKSGLVALIKYTRDWEGIMKNLGVEILLPLLTCSVPGRPLTLAGQRKSSYSFSRLCVWSRLSPVDVCVERKCSPVS